MKPLPLQAGGPPVLSASLSPRSIRRAARWADGLCGFSFGPSVLEVAGSFQVARDAWEQADALSVFGLVEPLKEIPRLLRLRREQLPT